MIEIGNSKLYVIFCTRKCHFFLFGSYPELFRVTSDSAPGLLLVVLGGPHGILRAEPGSEVCTAKAQPSPGNVIFISGHMLFIIVFRVANFEEHITIEKFKFIHKFIHIHIFALTFNVFFLSF